MNSGREEFFFFMFCVQNRLGNGIPREDFLPDPPPPSVQGFTIH